MTDAIPFPTKGLKRRCREAITSQLVTSPKDCRDADLLRAILPSRELSGRFRLFPSKPREPHDRPAIARDDDIPPRSRFVDELREPGLGLVDIDFFQKI